MSPPASDIALSSLLRDVAPLCHPRRGEVLVRIADALENGAPSIVLRKVSSIASEDRAPAKLRRDDQFSDLGFLDTGRKQDGAKNRDIARRIVEAGGAGDDPASRMARCLGFSFTRRGLP